MTDDTAMVYVVPAAPDTRAIFIDYDREDGETWHTTPVIAWKALVVDAGSKYPTDLWVPLVQEGAGLVDPEGFDNFFCVLEPGYDLSDDSEREIRLRIAERDVDALEAQFAAPATGRESTPQREPKPRRNSPRLASKQPEPKLSPENERALIEHILNT